MDDDDHDDNPGGIIVNDVVVAAGLGIGPTALWQVNWVNYLQRRYGLSATIAGMTLCLVGLIVAVVPSFTM